jgi:Flp pilus assembly protein CpaB
MKSRGLVVALALLLAIGATAAVFLYVNGVREDASTTGTLTPVIVSTQDIQANAELDPLLAQDGVFVTKEVPETTIVDGAVTDLTELQGRTTSFPIIANEQIPVSRLDTGEGTLSNLSVSPGHIGTTVRVDGPAGVGGNIIPGSNVTVYATFSGVKVFKSFKDLINSATGSNANANAPTTQAQTELPALTLILIPTVRVLKVENPVPTDTGEKSGGQVTLTLDLLPEDSESLVYATENGSLWFGLLPPGEDGVQLPAATVPLDKVLGKKAA